jgi:carboxylesterase
VNPLLLLAPIVAIAVGVANRRRISRHTETGYRAQFAPGGEHIVPGAESFLLEGTNGKALLLIHGSGDTPQSLRYLGEHLHGAGYTVYAPLLPGHGRSPRAFAKATAAQYYDATREAHAQLRGSHEWVGLVGLSMGGALTARLAAEHPEIPLLVLLAPYLEPPRFVRVVGRMSWLWNAGLPYVAGGGDFSIHDEEARAASKAYGTFSRGALDALIETADAGRRGLPRLKMPMLVVNSVNDNRIPRAVAERALRSLAPSTERHWVEGCGHVITVDYCKATVARLVLSFLARHAG